MLRGEKVGLRARVEADVAVLHAELYDDVSTWLRASSRPWRPVGPGPRSTYAVGEPAEDVAAFSVVTLDDDELVGAALLWGIDRHSRMAHIGISLLPAFRDRGLGSDVVQVLCRYGFVVLGLHRLQVETLVDNVGMVHAATKAGFVPEGTLRSSAWVNGEFIDEVVLGLLATEWQSG